MWKVNNLDSKLKNLQQTPKGTYPMTVNYLFYEGKSFIFVFWWYLGVCSFRGLESSPRRKKFYTELRKVGKPW